MPPPSSFPSRPLQREKEALTRSPSDSTTVALRPLQVHQQLIGIVLAGRGSFLLLPAKVQGDSGAPDDLFWDIAARQTHFLLQGCAS